MNHSMTVASVAHQLNESRLLAGLNESAGIPFILGETNSLYNEGKPGLSNSFGAALWGVGKPPLFQINGPSGAIVLNDE